MPTRDNREQITKRFRPSREKFISVESIAKTLKETEEAQERLCLKCKFNYGLKLGIEPTTECSSGLPPICTGGEDCPYFIAFEKKATT